jgi:hypothetical protein
MHPVNNRTTVVVDVSQKSIIENRRKQREQLLKQIGQLTAMAENNLEKLAYFAK